MILYDAMTPNSLRVDVFLAEKGVDVTRKAVDVIGGGTRTDAFLAKNSRGEVLSIADITGMAALMVADLMQVGLPPDAEGASARAARMRAQRSFSQRLARAA